MYDTRKLVQTHDIRELAAPQEGQTVARVMTGSMRTGHGGSPLYHVKDLLNVAIGGRVP